MLSRTSTIARLSVDRGIDDASLVARAIEGETWAKEALYRRHVHKVTGIVARLLRNSSDIEDVVQETFIQGYQDLHQLNDPNYVGRWFVTIAVRKVHRRYRKRKLARLLGLDRSFDDEGLMLQASRSANQEARAELALLDSAFDEMSIAQRACWTLRHLEEHRLQEVASIVGCSLATAKRRIASAQAIVDRHFEEVHNG